MKDGVFTTIRPTLQQHLLEKANPADIRTWAQSKGMDVANRRKIPHDIL